MQSVAIQLICSGMLSRLSIRQNYAEPARQAGLEADFRQQLYVYEEQQRMPYVTTVEQAGIQQGEASILLRLPSTKFGAESAEQYRTLIEAAEPEQLERWSERILNAETPEMIFH